MSLLTGCAVQMLGEEGQTAAAAPAATQPEATATPTAETEADTAAAESNAASQDEVDDAARLAQLLQVQEARLAYNGEILAEKRIAIAPEVNGLAIAVHVQIGDEVKVGDVLVEIDATTLEAAREQAMAGLISAQS
ncbi:MAG: biotin/lipoyl-binding protein, partial [Caldilineaceae bacterium]|nr:biotin/lipoyl-binding protein [Caldilineaceae bacterium]